MRWALLMFIPISLLFGVSFYEKLSISHTLEYWAVVATFYTTCVGFVLFAVTHIHELTPWDRGMSVIVMLATVVLALYSMAEVQHWFFHLVALALMFLLYYVFDLEMITCLEQRGCQTDPYRQMISVDGSSFVTVITIIGTRMGLEVLCSTGSVATTECDHFDMLIAGATATILVYSFMAFIYYLSDRQ